MGRGDWYQKAVVSLACAAALLAGGCDRLARSTDVTGRPAVRIDDARGYWLARELIAWKGDVAHDALTLYFARDGGLALGREGLIGADGSLRLIRDPAGLPVSARRQFPHLATYGAYRIAERDRHRVPALLKGQVVIAAVGAAGQILDATNLQLAGALDDLYAFDGPLGPTFSGDVPSLRLWAPTAHSVTLELFDGPALDAPARTLPMHEDPATGTWTITGAPGWKDRYYRYVVEVYVPATGRVERNAVTDPYSLGLATNSRLSLLVDLDDPALMPEGWHDIDKPLVAAPEDIVIYELHVRDFSAADDTVPARLRGTYGAFTVGDSRGMRYLSSLADAGITHLHLLPTFDIASIEENRARWRQPDATELARYAADSDRQQAAVMATANEDAYNWGYDPWHYTVPDGSYAAEPEGSARTLEYRRMVRALNAAGLNVVMDVVYNHTAMSGQGEQSVLDRIVPGYYHRLSATGAVENSTCCENTAAEHRMMAKLMVDSLVTWARAYRIDGFRFDLMGHHPKSTLLEVRAALDALTIEQDGVDGKAIYLYGEGWNFGEVADGARFEQAIQATLAGTGIGTFNDRLRDGARGGTPFSDPREQGFATGLAYDPNDYPQDHDPAVLARHADWVRLGLAGNLRDFRFENAAGETVPGRDIVYAGQPAGYTADPAENIVYVAAHDNQTLFDSIQFKAPLAASTGERVRMQNFANSLVLLAQGVPFVHAGQDFLRSKSLDHDSYNSGDWFNAIDWRFETSNWARGLPVANRNEAHWPLMGPLLANRDLAASRADRELAARLFREWLAIRKSSPLFRLRTAAEIQGRLAFHNTGPDQQPGLIVMSLSDEAGDIDAVYSQLVVLFNANDEAARFAFPGTDAHFDLHPVQAVSADPLVRTALFDGVEQSFFVPGRTTAVFVARRAAR